MRRTATGMAVLASLTLFSGCRSFRAPWSPPASVAPAHPLDEPEVRTSRDAVPDEVMIPSQARGGYSDSPSGQ